MTSAMFATWVAAGLTIGWVAHIVTKRGGNGLMGDLSLGLVGSIVGSSLCRGLDISPGSGVFAVFIALTGAATAILAQRALWPMQA